MFAKSDVPMIHQNLTYTIFIIAISSMLLDIAMEVYLSHDTKYAKLYLQVIISADKICGKGSIE